MRQIGIVLCVFLSASAFTVAQNSQRKQRFVLEPSEHVLLLIASQPDCPVTIENAQRFLDLDESVNVRYRYQLHNRGTKAIRSVSVVEWSSFGTGGTLVPRWTTSNGLFLPAQRIKDDGGISEDEMVPLTEQVRNRLALRGPLKAIIVLMIERIEYADGSKYDDKLGSDAVSNYFQRLDNILSRAPRTF